jgi:hypothetical protein
VVEVDDFEARRQTFVRNKHGSTNPVRLGGMSQWMREFRGLTNTELAVELAVSEGTVRNMLLYAEAADRWPEREAEIAKMSVKQVRDLLSDKEEKAKAAPDESPRLTRLKKEWDLATTDERRAFMKFAQLEPVGAATATMTHFAEDSGHNYSSRSSTVTFANRLNANGNRRRGRSVALHSGG